MKKSNNSFIQRAFTMIEMMVALILLSIGLLGFSAMSVLMIRTNSTATRLDEAATLAQGTIEDMSGILWTDLGTDTTTPSENGLTNGDVYTAGPMNRNGELSGTGTGPYTYYRHIVVCSNGLTVVAGGSPDNCPETVTASNRPTALDCDGLGLTAREKMLRVLVSWKDRDGRCRFKAIDSLVFE